MKTSNLCYRVSRKERKAPVDVFKYYGQIKPLVRKDCAAGTHAIFETTYKYTAAQLLSGYKLKFDLNN